MPKSLICPKGLKIGDKIAILSPSEGLSFLFPHVLNKGIESLESMGFLVEKYPFLEKDEQALYSDVAGRKQELLSAFKDSSISGIIFSDGGTDYNRVVMAMEPEDWEVIQKNPKLIMGFSDNSGMLNAIFLKTGLVTFLGPSIMVGFAQMKALPQEYESRLKDFLLHPQCLPLSYEPYSGFSPGVLDNKWRIKNECHLVKSWENAPGWELLQGEETVTGRLIGGNFETLQMLAGTSYWPVADESFWQGKILVLETSEFVPTPEQVMTWLRNWNFLGVFQQLSGLIFGRAFGYEIGHRASFNKALLCFFKEEVKNTTMPVLSNFDTGHTFPQLVLPIGGKVRMICNPRPALEIVEACFC